jgi:phosphoglucosamine mutase
MRKIFGTDGIRGRANSEPMTAETALKVAMATIAELRDGDHHHRVIIGKDTRLSGYMIEQALTAGFLSLGADVILVGPLPTPAIAMLTRALRADLGVMVSASHNPKRQSRRVWKSLSRPILPAPATSARRRVLKMPRGVMSSM